MQTILPTSSEEEQLFLLLILYSTSLISELFQLSNISRKQDDQILRRDLQ